MFDSHNHTNHSHDSQCDIDDLCLTAIKKGISGITISDHCDIEYYKRDNVFQRIQGSFAAASKAKQDYKNKLTVLAGIEIGEGIWDKSATAEISSSCDFDSITASVHAVRYPNFFDPYAQLTFAEDMLDGFLKQYFIDLLETAETIAEADILAHLTCPYRYISGKFAFPCNWRAYEKIIDEVLKTIIRRNIALEINTSGIDNGINDFMPPKDIVMKYKSMGGELLTIGSDSHAAQRVGIGFSKAKDMLRSCGYDSYHYFEKRKPIAVKL